MGHAGGEGGAGGPRGRDNVGQGFPGHQIGERETAKSERGVVENGAAGECCGWNHNGYTLGGAMRFSGGSGFLQEFRVAVGPKVHLFSIALPVSRIE